MKAKIEIKMDNAAFDDDRTNNAKLELARILMELAERLGYGNQVRSLYDSNGNIVGTFKIED